MKPHKKALKKIIQRLVAGGESCGSPLGATGTATLVRAAAPPSSSLPSPSGPTADVSDLKNAVRAETKGELPEGAKLGDVAKAIGPSTIAACCMTHVACGNL